MKPMKPTNRRTKPKSPRRGVAGALARRSSGPGGNGMAQEESKTRNGPMDRLKGGVGELAGALGTKAVTSLLDRVEGTTGRLHDYVEGGAGPGLMAAVTGAKDLAEGKSPARSMLGAGMTGVKEKISGLFRRGGK